ncbi:hypothetical protein EH243_07200 [Amphritea opalescens]|uniref:Uncharacterized protein n=1 Tax=Amphritea opalescens TaxID=2490544 RepID=A0A430KS82_9GAMM|nr:hypothetical protein [Amphritea opalescens]RTE66375.1 hypothetical protein EH243_07200 [Amphritea opalescens]
MRNLLILIILAAVGVGYLYLNQPQPTPVATPTVEPDELSKMAAKRHIESLTSKPDQVIEIGQANNFVTQDQLLKLPTDQTTASAGTQAVSDGNAITFGVQLDTIGNSQQHQNAIILASQLPMADQIRLKELLNNPDNSADTLFYIHGVNASDNQGLWGIIQQGLIDTFASGIQLEQQTISAAIPVEADERLDNKNSSFLGTILDEKVKDTYVYNYHKGVLGQNPDLITPGQELIIVTFTQDELIDIYNHFNQQQ